MFLSDIHLPTISDEYYTICEAKITEDNLLQAFIHAVLLMSIF